MILILCVYCSHVYATDTIICTPYSTSRTDSATNFNTITCSATICGSRLIRASTCGNCIGDSYIRMYSAGNIQLTLDDNGCGLPSLCSQITYLQTSDECTVYNFKQGCYRGTSCGGTLTIDAFRDYAAMINSSAPTLAPTRSPSYSRTPTTSPTTRFPTLRPSMRPTRMPSVRPTALPSRQPTKSTILYAGSELSCSCDNPQCRVRLCEPTVLSTHLDACNADDDQDRPCMGQVELIREKDGVLMTNTTTIDSFQYLFTGESCVDFVARFYCHGLAVVKAANPSVDNSASGQSSKASSFLTTLLIVMPTIMGFFIITSCIIVYRRKIRRSNSRAVTPTNQEDPYAHSALSTSAVHEVHAQLLNTGNLSQLMQSHGQCHLAELPRAVVLGDGSLGGVAAVVDEVEVVASMGPGTARFTSVPVLEVVDVVSPYALNNNSGLTNAVAPSSRPNSRPYTIRGEWPE